MSLLLLLTGYPQGGQGTPPEPEPEPVVVEVAGGAAGNWPALPRTRFPAELSVTMRDYREAEEEFVLMELF